MTALEQVFEEIRTGGRPSMPLIVKACREKGIPLVEVKTPYLRGDLEGVMAALQVAPH